MIKLSEFWLSHFINTGTEGYAFENLNIFVLVHTITKTIGHI